MNTIDFIYSEKLVADQLGLSQTKARELRSLHLEEGRDWQKLEGSRSPVLLSERGVERIAKWTDQEMPNLELCIAVQKKNGAPQKMIVIARCMNPKMVLANETGDANAARHLVDVGYNKNMAIGDEMEVGPHDSAQKGVFKCLTRLPRNTRRPQFCGSARDPNNWGQREMNVMVARERAREAGKK